MELPLDAVDMLPSYAQDDQLAASTPYETTTPNAQRTDPLAVPTLRMPTDSSPGHGQRVISEETALSDSLLFGRWRGEGSEGGLPPQIT